MSPSSYESLIFDSIDLNNAVSSGWSLEKFTLPPPSKRLQRLSASDAPSDILAEAAQSDLRIATATIRYEGAANMDAALAAIRALTGRLQRCEELEEGSPLDWTPANSTRTGRLWVQSAEITDMPIEQDGELAGWLLTKPEPILTVRFDCFPFLEGAEYTAATLASTNARVASMEVADVPGDVPALARLVITDTGATSRGQIEVGGDRYGYNSASPSDLDILAQTEMTALAGTLTGSYIGMTVGSSPIGLCEATNLPHVGPHNIRAVMERTATGTTIRVRAAMRTVDGQWSYTSWKTVPSGVGTYDMMLGDMTFRQVDRGNQVSTLRIEVMASAASVIRCYRVHPFPTEVVYTVARQRVGGAPSSLDGFDSFEQTAGNLDAPKAAPIGGNWAEAIRTGANGFQVETTGKTAQRTTVSDTSFDGCYAFLGANAAATVVQGSAKFSAVGSASGSGSITATARFGLLARYVDSNNWLALALVPRSGNGGLTLFKKVGGTTTVVKELLSAYFAVASISHALRLEVDANGTYRAYWFDILMFSGVDPDLATGGTLATGKRGLYDMWAPASANTRNFDDFQAPAAPPVDYPLYSGRSVEFASTYAIREASGGTNWAPISLCRGRRLTIPPAGPGNLKTRLVIKDTSADVDGGAPDGTHPSRSATLYLTPRYLVTP